MLPEVSVIIPTYNRADLLIRAIQSVLNQTFKNFELIIVDDGSSDNTKERVQELQKEDEIIKYLWQENSGTPAGALNAGIKIAKGKYVAFLDDDDEWLPQKLEKQLALFHNSKTPNLGIVGCGSFIIRGGTVKTYQFPKTGNILKSLLEKSVFLSCSSNLIKRDVFAKVGLFDESFKLFFARDMWLKICCQYDFDFIDEPLYKYYIHESNLSRKDPIREAAEIEHLIRKWQADYEKFPIILSQQLKTIGSLYALKGDMKSARKYFISALKAAPYSLKNFLILFLSFFGTNFYKKALPMKRIKIKKRIKLFIYSIFRPFVIKKLRKAGAKCQTPEDYIDLVFSFNFPPFRFINIKPGQVKEEILGLLKILKNKQPQNILEIGTANGGTFYLFARIAHPQATLISVDLPGGPFGGSYPECKTPLYKSFAGSQQKIYLIRADSVQKTTIDKVKEILDNSKLDLLFIDGDHTYEGVKKDFEIYSQFVKKGGVIAFHDIVPHPLGTGCEVNKFWKEIRERYQFEELVKSWEQGWGGIGVIYV